MSDDRDRSGGRFLRGLTIGAILGAIIAGSRIWARSRPAAVPRPHGRDLDREERPGSSDPPVPHDVE